MSSNVYILLDRSGSMSTKWSDTIGTINAYVKKLAEQNRDGTVTVLSFSSDSGYRTSPHLLGVPEARAVQSRTGNAEMVAHGIAVKPSEWAPLGSEVYPNGGTPLFDAVSHIVAVTQQDRNPTGELHIFTDGEENTSIACNRDSAKLLLDGVRARGWSVDQYGIEFDNYRQSASMGTSVRNTVSMSAHAMRSGAVAEAMAAKSMSYTASGVDQGYTDNLKGLMGDPTVQQAVAKTVAAAAGAVAKAVKTAKKKATP